MRVAVVGGGVMGAATAWQLQRRGVDVTLHEQFSSPTHVNGSSHGGSRIFRFAYEDAMYVRLAQAALGEWRALEAAAGEPLLDITGGVDHGTRAEIEQLSDALSAAGATHEVLPGGEAEARFPGMRFDELVVVHPDGGRCRAGAAVAALHRLVEDVRYDSRIEDVRALEADVVVCAMGAWTPLPSMTVTEEQIQHFTPRDSSSAWPSFIHRTPAG
ncbi:MAG TPA: FAD-dependent oxidoreductase, partial [Acidimicrobiales bacterium]|nr:FAD-dependent oxidoreductase [Acidimicrobiales bacterium]